MGGDIPDLFSALQQRAVSVIGMIVPQAAKEQVERTVRQWNQALREHIRNETGLRLSVGEDRSAIPVRVTDGFTDRFASLIDRNPDPVLWRLILGIPKLAGMVEGSEFLLRNWESFEAWPQLPTCAKKGRRPLERSLKIGNALRELAGARRVQKDLRSIDEDILGMYSFGGMRKPSISVFWMPIALISATLGVQAEDLTLVTLIHELGHGYTHLGRDIGGRCWNDNAFAGTEPAVVEGLAQFYTAAVAERLRSAMPGVRDAYLRFLDLQSKPYQAHLGWLKDETRREEAVRFALVSARSSQPVTHPERKRLLSGASAKLNHGTKKPRSGQSDLFGEEL